MPVLKERYQVSRVYLLILISIVLAITSCSDKFSNEKNNVKKEARSAAGLAHKSDNQAEKLDYVNVVKQQTLPDYPVKTVGAALDSYSHFAKHDWQVTEGSRGKIYIDYIGWLKDKGLEKDAEQRGVVAQGVNVKFIIDEHGVFGVVLTTKVEKRKDNTVSAYPFEKIKAVLDSIYGDREVGFK